MKIKDVQFIFILSILECIHIQADPNFVDIALNEDYVKLKLKGDRMTKEMYAKEGSSCYLKADSTSASTIPAEIESILDSYAEIKIPDPKAWMYRGSEYQGLNVICDFKMNSDKNTTERRTTRTIKGGGSNDGFINGGGVVVVNSNDLLMINASVQLKKPPLTHDVSVIKIKF